MMRKLQTWLVDYVYAAKLYSQFFVHRHPPEHYLGYVDNTKVPVILIPGVNTKWHFLKKMADSVSKTGHPVHVVKELGYNRKEIATSAKLVRIFIDEKALHNVIILAHSKGGLIGKEVLLAHNQDNRIIKVIAIAAPFLGSKLAARIPDKAITELAPHSAIVQEHNARATANADIISIYGLYDNHVWPTENSILVGAENIVVTTGGHHQILLNPKT